MNLPLACTLTEAQLSERRQAITDTFRNVQVTTSELPDGYTFTFPASSEALKRIAKLVDMERQCCPFLTFKIVVEGANARLEVTGPKEAKAAITAFFAVNKQ